MNCKPGDLAVIVHPEADGVLVHVDGPPRDRWSGSEDWGCTTLTGMTAYKGGTIPHRVEAGTQVDIADRVLRPLRNDPGTDETLQRKTEREWRLRESIATGVFDVAPFVGV